MSPASHIIRHPPYITHNVRRSTGINPAFLCSLYLIFRTNFVYDGSFSIKGTRERSELCLLPGLTGTTLQLFFCVPLFPIAYFAILSQVVFTGSQVKSAQ